MFSLIPVQRLAQLENVRLRAMAYFLSSPWILRTSATPSTFRFRLLLITTVIFTYTLECLT